VTIFEFESDDFHKRCYWTSPEQRFEGQNG